MARTNRAMLEIKSADLASEWGLAYAIRLFGEEAIASLPVRTRGPNKGKPKGYVLWAKTTTAGYCVYVSGGAPAGMVVRAWIGAGPFSPESDALRGKWLGREQAICGSRCYLGEEGRARAAAERAEWARDQEAVQAAVAAAG